jgi:hypothetical protein
MTVLRVLLLGVSCVALAAQAAAETTPPAAKTAAAPAAAKPAPGGHDGRHDGGHGGSVTIYFLRPSGLMNIARLGGAVNITVDGRKIGELPAGTYFVASEATGHHVLGVKGGFLDGGRESEVDLAAAHTYYLQIGPVSTGAPGQDLANMLVSGTRGQELPGHGFNAAMSFHLLDAEFAKTEMAKMQKLKP